MIGETGKLGEIRQIELGKLGLGLSGVQQWGVVCTECSVYFTPDVAYPGKHLPALPCLGVSWFWPFGYFPFAFPVWVVLLVLQFGGFFQLRIFKISPPCSFALTLSFLSFPIPDKLHHGLQDHQYLCHHHGGRHWRCTVWF